MKGGMSSNKEVSKRKCIFWRSSHAMQGIRNFSLQFQEEDKSRLKVEKWKLGERSEESTQVDKNQTSLSKTKDD